MLATALFQKVCLWFHRLLQTVGIEKNGKMGKEETDTMEKVEAVERILCYRFKDRNLLVEALTHGSYFYPEKSSGTYERLEFMGDAVLNCLMAKQLFSTYTDLAPGPLTRLRAANVDTEKLGRVAINHGLHRYIRHRVSTLNGQIEDFVKAIRDYPMHSNGLVETPKLLADIVESLLGAVFADSGYSLEKVWEVFKVLLEPMITPETLGTHPVTELYEFCQKNGMQIAFLNDTWKYNTIVEVSVNDHVIGSGKYKPKREIAQNRAAKDALDKLKASCKRTNLEAI